MVKFVLHFLFLVAALAYLARRGRALYWRALAAFCGGMVAERGLRRAPARLAATAGVNLDQAWLQPLTGGASAINVYGAVYGQDVYRPNGLTGDPNHLGIELAVALLILTPIYLRLERGHRLRIPLAAGLAFLLLVELATLSRSGLLGLAAASPCSRCRTGLSCARPRSGSRSAPSPC